jgi:spermidine/putrescine transport system substrate-binding protein
MGWQGYEESFKAGDFAAKNDIVVNATYQNDNSHAIATASGGGIGNMDIVTPDTAYTAFMREINILQKLDLERIPNFAELDPFFQGTNGARIGAEQWALPFAWTIIPLMYDANNVNEAPTSWHDMLKPEYKGKVGLTNDLISMIVCFTLAVTEKIDATRITKAELKEVLDFIVNLKKNHARTVVSSYGELTDLMASGEIWLAQGWVPVQLWAADKGGNVKWVIPKEGAHAPVDCMAMVRDAPHEEATYKLLNHAISAEGQAYAANLNATGVTNTKAIALLDKKITDIQPHNDIASFYKKTTGGEPLPLWPTEADGDLATLDDVLDAWDKFMAA